MKTGKSKALQATRANPVHRLSSGAQFVTPVTFSSARAAVAAPPNKGELADRGRRRTTRASRPREPLGPNGATAVTRARHTVTSKGGA